MASYAYYMGADVPDSTLGMISLSLQVFNALFFTVYFHGFAMSSARLVRAAGLESPDLSADRFLCRR